MLMTDEQLKNLVNVLLAAVIGDDTETKKKAMDILDSSKLSVDEAFRLLVVARCCFVYGVRKDLQDETILNIIESMDREYYD